MHIPDLIVFIACSYGGCVREFWHDQVVHKTHLLLHPVPLLTFVLVRVEPLKKEVSLTGGRCEHWVRGAYLGNMTEFLLNGDASFELHAFSATAVRSV